MTTRPTVSKRQDGFVLRDPVTNHSASRSRVRLKNVKKLCGYAWFTLFHPNTAKLECAPSFLPVLQLAIRRHCVSLPIVEGSDQFSCVPSDFNSVHRGFPPLSPAFRCVEGQRRRASGDCRRRHSWSKRAIGSNGDVDSKPPTLLRSAVPDRWGNPFVLTVLRRPQRRCINRAKRMYLSD